MREELKSGSFNSSASRVPSSSEAITQRVLKILRQPSGDTKPDAAAKLFAVAYQIGDGTSNLPGVNQAPVVLQPSAPNVTNRIFTRDGESAIKPLAFTTTTSPGTRSIRRRNASFRNTATLLRMRPRYQMERKITKVGFPTTVAEAAQYIELADAAYMRGFTRGDASPVLGRRLSRNQGTHAVARFPVTR